MRREVVIIRHGETPGNAEGRFQNEGIPLSQRGNEQAAHLAKRLYSEYAGRLRKIISSDLKRARETAMHIFDAFYSDEGVSLENHPILQERNFGELRGKLYRDVLAGVNLMDPNFRPPDGESVLDFDERVKKIFQFIKYQAKTAISEDDPDGVIFVVTHGMVKTSLLRNHFDYDEAKYPRVMFHNTAISIVEFDDSIDKPEQEPVSKPKIKLLNCFQHLPEDLRVTVKEEISKFKPINKQPESEQEAIEMASKRKEGPLNKSRL